MKKLAFARIYKNKGMLELDRKANILLKGIT